MQSLRIFSILAASIALCGFGPCASAPKIPDIEACGLIWTGDPQTSYGRCSKIITNPNVTTRRPNVEAMFKEKGKFIPLDDYTRLRKWESEIIEWAKGHCR